MALVVPSSLLLTTLSALFLVFHQFPVTRGGGDLITKTCQDTKFPNLCVSSLKSDPTSPNADTKGLAMIMVGIGMANATATASYLSSQLKLLTNNISSSSSSSRGGGATATTTILERVILKECSDKYSYASNALHGSLEDLAAEKYDYAFMHISAAADYPNACHNAFKRIKGLPYPSELARRETVLKHICEVVSGIVNLLGW